MRTITLVSTILLITSVNARAQIINPIAGGVYVDPDGVVRTRELDAFSKKALRRSKPQGELGLHPVSLPKLFADARREIEEEGKLSDKTRYMGGLVDIQSVRVDLETKEIFLEGHADVFQVEGEERVLGERSGRPLLRMEDFVTALRTHRPGNRAGPFGCSIDLPEGAMGRLAQAARELVAQGNYQPGVIARTVKEALGQPEVRIFALPTDSPFALWCLEADIRLKRLALGLDPSPVKKVKSHLALSRESGATYSRWWFVADYEPLLVSEDGLHFQIRGPRLKILASDSPTSDSTPSASAQKFVSAFNANFIELCQGIPAFADLQNLSDFGVVAALIAMDRLDEKVGWDTQWIMESFPVPTIVVPTKTDPLVNMVQRGRAIQVATGGVQIDTRAIVDPKNRKTANVAKEPSP